MELDYLRCLVVLGQERDWARTATACGISQAELAKAIRKAEEEHRHALVKPGTSFQGFTPEGELVLAWARDFYAAHEALKQSFRLSKKQEALSPLLRRRSVSPKRLQGPGPDAQELDLMVQAALTAPDHGGLHPWRLLEFQADQREALAECFAQEKLRRDPLAPPTDLRRAREHATRPPVLMAFIVSPKARTQVPVREQWLAAGAALGNLLNATHQLGFGAIMLSGERCFDTTLCQALGVQAEEFLAGFISVGSIAEAPPARKPLEPVALRSNWIPPTSAAAPLNPVRTAAMDPPHDNT